MSGIGGIYHLDQRPVDRVLLQRMLDCIAHRGSEAVRTWSCGSIGLGHRQLCTTEESLRETQPAQNQDGTCRITFDGRVDNRDELINRLRSTWGKLDAPTDVDLMLYAYDTWGVECLKWVIGDFAFALWDEKNQQLFCARDTYGVRPFYYHLDGKTFTFGSDCIQLFQHPFIRPEVDSDKVAEWFTYSGFHYYLYRDLARTFFRGISELPFASYLVIKPAGVQSGRYWNPGEIRPVRYRRKQEYAEHFLQVFRDAVRCRLRSCAPVGAELSGGFDSSSIVCVAQEMYRTGEVSAQRFATFSQVFDDLSCDERPLIDSVVNKYDLEYHYLPADDLCGLRTFPDQAVPFVDLNYPDQAYTQAAMDALYRLAAKMNFRVILSGEGAENHLLGYRVVLDSILRGFQFSELYRRLRSSYAETTLRNCAVHVVKFGLVPLLPQPISMPLYYRWMRPALSRPHVPAWFTPTFQAQILEQVSKQRERLRALGGPNEWARRIEFETLSPSNPAVGMAFPSLIERRFPYLDRRVIEFCLAIPPERKYQCHKGGMRRRALQRQAMVGILPEEIRHSTQKTYFSDVGKRRFQVYRDVYLQMLAAPDVPLVAKLGYIDHAKLRQIVTQIMGGIDNIADKTFSSELFWIHRVLLLEIWLRGIHRFSSSVTSSECSNSEKSENSNLEVIL